jgi:hypothetical protein
MMDKKNYKVVSGTNLESVELDVNRKLDEGFRLVGGISIHVFEGSAYDVITYAQALVKDH